MLDVKNIFAVLCVLVGLTTVDKLEVFYLEDIYIYIYIYVAVIYLKRNLKLDALYAPYFLLLFVIDNSL